MTETKKKYASKRNLTPAEWGEIKFLWERGEVTLAELGKKYRVSKEHIQRRLKKEGSEKGSKADEHVQKITDKAVEASAAKISEILRRKESTKDQHYRWAEIISRLIVSEIIEAKNNKQPFGMISPNVEALTKALNGLEKAMGQRWKALGLDVADFDESELPELIITELTTDQVKKIQDAHKEVDTDLTPEEEELDRLFSDEIENSDEDSTVVFETGDDD